MYKCWASSGEFISWESPDPCSGLSWWHASNMVPSKMWTHGLVYPSVSCQNVSPQCLVTRYAKERKNNMKFWYFISLKITMKTPPRESFSRTTGVLSRTLAHSAHLQQTSVLPVSASVIPYSELSFVVKLRSISMLKPQ